MAQANLTSTLHADDAARDDAGWGERQFRHVARHQVGTATAAAPTEAGTAAMGAGGKGSKPAAMSGAVADIAEAGVAFARGSIDAAALAERCCEATLETVIPVPIVAGLVGGLVGQTAATLISQGLRTALSDARAELAAGIAVDEEFLAARSRAFLGSERNDDVSATVGPLLDDALIAVADVNPDECLKRWRRWRAASTDDRGS